MDSNNVVITYFVTTVFVEICQIMEIPLFILNRGISLYQYNINIS